MYGTVIPDHENYSITKEGIVWKNCNKAIKISLDKGGYYCVYIDGEKRYLHQLLALVYVPNPNGYPRVYFRDGNTKNISISNLYWADYHQKEIHKLIVCRLITRTSGISFSSSVTYDGQLVEEVEEEYNTIQDIADALNVPTRSIAHTLKTGRLMPTLAKANIISIRRKNA